MKFSAKKTDLLAENFTLKTSKMTQFRSQTKIVERTVLPPFFPYISTDSVDFGHAVDGYKRIDVDKLRKLISIKPATKIDEICTGEGENAKFDISFQIRVAQCTSGIFDRLQAFQFHVKRKVLKYDSISDVKNAAASDGDNCNILASNLIQPQTSQFQDKKAPIAMPFDAEHVGQIFSANSLPGTSCAALILPYKSFPLTDMINLNKPDKMSQLKLGVEDVQLVKEIVAATPRPVFVQELAQRFIDEVLQCGKIRSSVRVRKLISDLFFLRLFSDCLFPFFSRFSPHFHELAVTSLASTGHTTETTGWNFRAALTESPLS